MTDFNLDWATVETLDELLSIIRDIWNRRASTSETGDGYEVVLTGDLCERIRQALGEELCPHGWESWACNECRGQYDEPWDPEPDYDDSLFGLAVSYRQPRGY
jgi:hypothetical protein